MSFLVIDEYFVLRLFGSKNLNLDLNLDSVRICRCFTVTGVYLSASV